MYSNDDYDNEEQEGEAIEKIEAGANYTVALRENGEIWTWGYGAKGALGNGNTTNQTLPVTTNTSNIVDITAGASITAIRNITGNLYIAGNNSYGRFGNGGTANSAVYTAITTPGSGSSGIKDVKANGRNTVILLRDGTIWTSGDNTYKQLSAGSTAAQSTSYVQAKNSDGSNITNAKSIGRTGSSILTSQAAYQNLSYIGNNGKVYVVGDNTYGQFGNGTKTASDYYTEMGAPYLNYSSGDIVLAVGENQTINSNKFEIDGEFSVDINFTPTQVGTLSFSTEDTNISVNSTTGKVTGLEEGYAKVKVTDTTNNYETFITVKVVNDKNTKTELGSKFTVGLTADGNVWTWGSNTFGELGTNSSKPYEDEPKHVTTISNIKDISVGYYHAVALDEDGHVWTWGLNNNGQLGNGNTTNSKEPVEIQNLSNIVKINAYKYITTAIDENGNVYAWGEGYGNTPKKIYENILDISEDVMITSDRRIMKLDGTLIHNVKNVVNVSSSENEILAILDNGQVVSIALDETATNLNVANGIDVSCGNGFNYILDKNKRAYTYGSNTNGELGIGTNTAVTNPTQISILNVETISAGEGNHGAMTTFDGSIYTTGLNDKGQLGHKNIDDKT